MCIPDYIHSTSFYLERFLKKSVDDQCPSVTTGSICHIKHTYDYTTFYHESELTWNSMVNGSIYYIWYLHILCFNFVWHNTLTLILLLPNSNMVICWKCPTFSIWVILFWTRNSFLTLVSVSKFSILRNLLKERSNILEGKIFTTGNH